MGEAEDTEGKLLGGHTSPTEGHGPQDVSADRCHSSWGSRSPYSLQRWHEMGRGWQGDREGSTQQASRWTGHLAVQLVVS